MVWREPRDHVTNCYFCIIKTKGVGKKNRHKISYPNISSAIPLVLHCEALPVPVFSGFYSSADSDDNQREHGGTITRWFLNLNSFQMTLIGYQPLSCYKFRLVCDLGLSKKAEKILTSRLQEKYLLDNSAKVSYYRKRDQSFAIFFSEQKTVCLLSQYSWSAQAARCCLVHPN